MTCWRGWTRSIGSFRQRLRVAVLGLSMMLWAASVHAQTCTPSPGQTACTSGPCPVLVNQPFTACFDVPSGPVSVIAYRLYLDGVKVGSDIPAGPTPIAVPGLKVTAPGQHSLEATAVGTDGESPKTPPLALIATATDTVPPSPPTHLTAVPTTTQVTLGWEPATDNVGVRDYSVSRGTTQLGIVTGLTFTESGLTPGTAYPYSVVAYDAAGNASAPATVSVTTLAQPAPCMSQGKPYSITIAVQSYSKQVAPGGRGAVQLTLANSFPVTLLQIRLGPQVVGEIPGLELRDITGVGFSVPTIRGTYQLFVSARDSQGCVTSTTLARPLVVQ